MIYPIHFLFAVQEITGETLGELEAKIDALQKSMKEANKQCLSLERYNTTHLTELI